MHVIGAPGGGQIDFSGAAFAEVGEIGLISLRKNVVVIARDQVIGGRHILERNVGVEETESDFV